MDGLVAVGCCLMACAAVVVCGWSLGWVAAPFGREVSWFLVAGSVFMSVCSFLASSSMSTCSPLAARLWYFFAFILA